MSLWPVSSDTFHLIETSGEIAYDLVNKSCSIPSMNEVEHVSHSAKNLFGRRIVNIDSFFKQLKSIDKHNTQCRFSQIEITNEYHRGFNSILKMKCTNCYKQFTIHTCEAGYEKIDECEKMDVNYSAILGSITIGIGFSQLAEISAIMDIPFMSHSTYDNIQKIIGTHQEAVVGVSMREAVEEEIAEAIKRGNLDENGIPLLTVVADCAWSHRSYGHGYKSLAGVAAICGYYSKKVLWIGHRNKFCAICVKYTNKNDPIPEHMFKCNRNYEGPSTGMEADIIVDGFKKSMELYGVKYDTLIADGDSSVYSALLKANIYQGTHIKKIGCSNHIIKNHNKRLRKLMSSSQSNIKTILNKYVKQMEKDVNVIIDIYHKKFIENPEKKSDLCRDMMDDIINLPNHVFDAHENGKIHFCENVSKISYDKLTLTENGVWDMLISHHKLLATHRSSLIHKVDTNTSEHFHSIVAKFVGGKRINFSMGQSYKRRCVNAVIQMNSKTVVETINKKFKSGKKLLVKRLLESRRKR